MVQTLVHVLPGLLALAAAALIVLGIGERRQKVVMTAVLVCWIGATLGQVLTGRLIAPLMVGDAVFAVWLLWYAWRGPAWWIYAVFAVEAGRLLLDALVFSVASAAWLPHARLNNLLSFTGLAVLSVAALLHALRRRRGSARAG